MSSAPDERNIRRLNTISPKQFECKEMRSFFEGRTDGFPFDTPQGDGSMQWSLLV